VPDGFSTTGIIMGAQELYRTPSGFDQAGGRALKIRALSADRLRRTHSRTRQEVAMRRIVVLVGAVVVVIGAMGVAGRMASPWPETAQRGARAKDAPRVAKPVAASFPLPVTPIEAAPGSRLEARRLLAARKFSELTRLFEAKQARAVADVRHEDELARVVLAFDVADEAMTDLLDDWVNEEPKSWPAHLARAKHLAAVAWARRGGKYRNETSGKQLAGFDEYLRRSLVEAQAALALDPSVIETYVVLIRIANGKGDQEACLTLGQQALGVDPASARAFFAIAYCLRPRWGGSYEAIEALAEGARRHAGRNPALEALGGFVDWDRGDLTSDDDDEEAIALYTNAIEAGGYHEYYEDRARSYEALRRYSDALADLAHALALRPEDPDLLSIRARILAELGRHRDAVQDVRLVAELEPDNDGLAWLRNHEAEDAIDDGRYMLDMKDVQGAIGRLDLGLAIAGEDAELLYWRGRAHILAKHFDAALADFEASIRLEPRHIEAYHNVDWLLARERRWNEIIAHWDAYLALEPLSGEALFERAGTHRHKGDLKAALADARKACELGVQKACDVTRR
jgi:tetratricopeptide (TPR) repeat protein